MIVIKAYCSTCQEIVEVADPGAGRTGSGSCPGCGNRIMVPLSSRPAVAPKQANNPVPGDYSKIGRDVATIRVYVGWILFVMLLPLIFATVTMTFSLGFLFRMFQRLSVP